MFRNGYLGVLAVMLATMSLAHGDEQDLQQQVDELRQQLQDIQEQLRIEQSGNTTSDNRTEDDAEKAQSNQTLVDLQDDQIDTIDYVTDAHVLSQPWWRNFDLSGFAAFGYYDTGSAGTRDYGSFEIKEASLFVTAEIWEYAEFFLELQTNRLGKDEEKFTRTGEVYVHFPKIALTESMDIGLKIGRIDIPFGEEYLWQDAIDNPLITNSAPYPYGWDEGVLVYGDIRGFDWIFAITDGTDARSEDENSDKAINIKISANPVDALDISLSLMFNGGTSKSAIEFGGSHFRPIGGGSRPVVARNQS